MDIFEQFKNKHQGETAYICASGPTLLDFKGPHEDGVLIGVNNSYMHGAIRDQLRYIIIERTPDLLNGIEDFNNLTQNQHLTVFTAPRINEIEQRDNIIIFTDTHKAAINVGMFNGCSSITFYCIMFALYCGFSKLYIVGCDCSRGKPLSIQHNSTNYEALLPGWTYMKEHFLTDVEVTVINPVNLTIFPSIQL